MSANFENAGKVLTTVNGVQKPVQTIYETVNGVYVKVYESSVAPLLVDFEYIDNGDGTATITAWKGTLNGVASTELVVPDDPRIIL